MDIPSIIQHYKLENKREVSDRFCFSKTIDSTLLSKVTESYDDDVPDYKPLFTKSTDLAKFDKVTHADVVKVIRGYTFGHIYNFQ